MQSRDLSVFDFDGRGELALLIKDMLPVGFDLISEHLLTVVMVGLGWRNRRDRGQAEKDRENGDQTLCTVHDLPPWLTDAVACKCSDLNIEPGMSSVNTD